MAKSSAGLSYAATINELKGKKGKNTKGQAAQAAKAKAKAAARQFEVVLG